jgi:oligoendopeptidase F
MRGVDWSGLDDAMKTGWHRKQHIHRRPFYYVEYGLAQLGAVQVGECAARSGRVVRQYRRRWRWADGDSPNLFAAAGARSRSTLARWPGSSADQHTLAELKRSPAS